MANRSCEECNRKKSKCDRKKPKCSRCQQSNRSCSYPASRKRPAFDVQYKKYHQKLLEEVEGGNAAILDRLLDRIDFNALQEAIRRRGSKSDNVSLPADMNFTEEVNSWGVDAFASGTELVPAYNTDNILSLDLTSGCQLDFEGIGMSMKESTYMSPTGTVWDLELDPSSGFNFADFSWNHMISSGMIGQTPSCMSEKSPSKSSPDANLGCESTISLPPYVIDELITLFFEKVASFIPLFHATNFQQRYRPHPDDTQYREVDTEELMILYGMFALSARFSTSPFFADTSPKVRGSVFSAMAQKIYEDAVRLNEIENCTFSLLQGCILLAFYYQTSRPSTTSWMLIGTCCRIAIELGLNKLDESIIFAPQDAQWTSIMEWSQKEEKRRAWWLVWELDVFSSTILRRPHTIDKSQMQVLLPVSDANWLANNPVASAAFPSDPLSAWGTLNDTPNQDERAWFLVSSYLMATAHDISQRHDTCIQDRANFAATLDCFSLLLPSSFHLSSGSLTFNERNFSSSNWIISTVFMLNTARILLGYNGAITNNSVDFSLPHGNVSSQSSFSCNGDSQLVFRAMQAWMPEFIASACPFVVCTILGPALYNVRAACTVYPQSGQATQKATSARYGIQFELLKLVLKRIGKFWDIGSSALRLLQILEEERGIPADDVGVEFEKLAKSFTLLVPSTP